MSTLINAVTLSEPRFTRAVEEKLAFISRKHNVPVFVLKHRLLQIMKGATQHVGTNKRGGACSA